MKNWVHDGTTLPLVLTEDTKSGRAVQIGDTFGVAVDDGIVGQKVAVTVVGVFELTKLPGALQQGERVFWQKAQTLPTPRDEGVTKTPDGNRLIGIAAESAAAGDLIVKVRLNGTF